MVLGKENSTTRHKSNIKFLLDSRFEREKERERESEREREKSERESEEG